MEQCLVANVASDDWARRSISGLRRPHHRRCGTGIGPDRDITAFRPIFPRPRVSADPGRSSRSGQPRLLDLERRIPARDKFAPDSPLEGTGFEPPVPLLRKGLPGLAEWRCRNDSGSGFSAGLSCRRSPAGSDDIAPLPRAGLSLCRRPYQSSNPGPGTEGRPPASRFRWGILPR